MSGSRRVPFLLHSLPRDPVRLLGGSLLSPSHILTVSLGSLRSCPPYGPPAARRMERSEERSDEGRHAPREGGGRTQDPR